MEPAAEALEIRDLVWGFGGGFASSSPVKGARRVKSEAQLYNHTPFLAREGAARFRGPAVLAEAEAGHQQYAKNAVYKESREACELLAAYQGLRVHAL